MNEQKLEALRKHHRQAFANRDSKALAHAFTEDATFITTEGRLNGRREIEQFFTYVFEHIPEDYFQRVHGSSQEALEENVLYLAYQVDGYVDFGSDVWIYEDNKIKTQIYFAKPTLNVVKEYFELRKEQEELENE